MRWTPKPQPRDGDIKWLTTFALLPKKCVGGKVVWLEKVLVRRDYWRGYYNPDKMYYTNTYFLPEDEYGYKK